MLFDGHDFTVLGVALGLGGGIILAKAYLVPSFPVESAQTFFDTNPFLVRNSIVTRHEAIAGVFWLVLAAVATIAGVVRTVRAGQVGSMISSWIDILTLIAALFLLARLTITITDRTSRNEYVPILANLQREAFIIHSYLVFHGGLSPQEIAHRLTQPLDVREQQLTAARKGLSQISKLLDEPRLDGEDDKSFTRRLSAYFPGVPLD